MKWRSKNGVPTSAARNMLRDRRSGMKLRELGDKYGGLSKEHIRQQLNITQRLERRLANIALHDLVSVLHYIKEGKCP